jgi:hypothetical protein
LCGLKLRRREGLETLWTAPLDHSSVVAFPPNCNLEAELEYLPRPRQCPSPGLIGSGLPGQSGSVSHRPQQWFDVYPR